MVLLTGEAAAFFLAVLRGAGRGSGSSDGRAAVDVRCRGHITTLFGGRPARAAAFVTDAEWPNRLADVAAGGGSGGGGGGGR